MAERSRAWWLSPRIVLPVLVVILVITAILAPQGLVTQEKLVSPTAAQSGCRGPLLVSVSMRNM